MDYNNICVVHLVRACNGIEPLECFLNSIKDHPAGLTYDLLFILKGFRENEIKAGMESLLNQYKHQRINVPDNGYDIDSYIAAAQLLENKYLCFFNSFSEILDNNWLEKLYRHVSSKGCGMVSATGSWESLYTDSLSAGRKIPMYSWVRKIVASKIKRHFLPFPNPHLRTNGFCISKKLFLDITRGYTIKDKKDTFLIESGRDGISRRIASRGLHLIVVGRDGRGFYPNEWSISKTFRQDEQENLLVADNQTRMFTDSDNSTRITLSQHAWGNEYCRKV
ncbi:MAG: hypothetical protein ABSE07_00470 [Methanoregula sp.]|jgi:hypothetical protein